MNYWLSSILYYKFWRELLAQFGLIEGSEAGSCLFTRSTLKKGRVSELKVLKYLSQLLHSVFSCFGNISAAEGKWLNRKNFFGMLDSLDMPTVSIYCC